MAHPGDQEEDDPDMIPLIDIALVLLIFFMMTAAVQSGMFGPIDTPPAEHQLTSIKEGTFFVAIDKDDKGAIRYGLGRDDKELQPSGPDLGVVLARLNKELEQARGEVRISLRRSPVAGRGHQECDAGIARAASADQRQPRSEPTPNVSHRRRSPRPQPITRLAATRSGARASLPVADQHPSQQQHLRERVALEVGANVIRVPSRSIAYSPSTRPSAATKRPRPAAVADSTAARN